MKRFKALSNFFLVVTILLSNVMFAVVSSKYTSMLYLIKYEGSSAPAGVALLYAIPFAIAIAVCTLMYIVLNKK